MTTPKEEQGRERELTGSESSIELTPTEPRPDPSVAPEEDTYAQAHTYSIKHFLEALPKLSPTGDSPCHSQKTHDSSKEEGASPKSTVKE